MGSYADGFDDGIAYALSVLERCTDLDRATDQLRDLQRRRDRGATGPLERGDGPPEWIADGGTEKQDADEGPGE